MSQAGDAGIEGLSRGAKRLLDRLVWIAGKRGGPVRTDQKRLGRKLRIGKDKSGKFIARDVSSRSVRAYLGELADVLTIERGGDGDTATYYFKTGKLPSALISGLLPVCFRSETEVESSQAPPNTEVAEENFRSEPPLHHQVKTVLKQPGFNGIESRARDEEKTARVTVSPRVTGVPFPQESKLSSPESEVQRQPNPNPEEEMKLRLQERHPQWEDCLKHIRKDMLKFGWTWAELVTVDDRCTTNPGRIKNPVGYYRDLFRRAKREAEAILRSETRPMEIKQTPRCAKCERGGGVMADGRFCDCAMGRDMARNARWKQKQTAAAGPGSFEGNIKKAS